MRIRALIAAVTTRPGLRSAALIAIALRPGCRALAATVEVIVVERGGGAVRAVSGGMADLAAP